MLGISERITAHSGEQYPPPPPSLLKALRPKLTSQRTGRRGGGEAGGRSANRIGRMMLGKRLFHSKSKVKVKKQREAEREIDGECMIVPMQAVD
ncbi:uncharacterized protein LY79DRAFT_533415 [Colletotrichum navitas]|uniref:Uncharacterized protein n=1 Tax=Colletotrichum navitas TaxID=681940 RepID=A0AAD8QEB7_9PEZI|nr:uncharacterized protein LY79DRAFT_533415 [Colletotrichum navitas]KAK1600386.1 hypothetical protein LY79DRAFT_533415 [Colletotrichum navitas]